MIEIINDTDNKITLTVSKTRFKCMPKKYILSAGMKKLFNKDVDRIKIQ